jgi:hypothetical protein
MILTLLFVVFFVGGPLAFRGLTREGPMVDSQRRLIIGTLVCAGTGLVMRYGFADLWGRNLQMTVVSVTLIWFAWIGVLAFGALKLRAMDQGVGMRRWTGIIGAAGTTMPWFGLASANLLQG